MDKELARHVVVTAIRASTQLGELIPLLLFFDPDLPTRLHTHDPAIAGYTVWYNIVRPIAVGTMLVGAANTMWSMRESLIRSLR